MKVATIGSNSGAACRGRTELFFAAPAERPEARLRREMAARAICLGCPVLEACRTWARTHHEYGFWGAESEEERAAVGYQRIKSRQWAGR